MSAWRQCHRRSSFVANWTGVAGTGWSSPSLLWSFGFQIPFDKKFNATGIIILVEITLGKDMREAEFINSSLQSLRISSRPPVWLCVILDTLTAPIGCLGFTCSHEVLQGFLHKFFLDAHGFPSQALCKGHEQQRCQGSCLSLLYCFNLQMLKGSRVVRCQSSTIHCCMDVSSERSLLVSQFHFLLSNQCTKKANPTWNYLKLPPRVATKINKGRQVQRHKIDRNMSNVFTPALVSPLSIAIGRFRPSCLTWPWSSKTNKSRWSKKNLYPTHGPIVFMEK